MSNWACSNVMRTVGSGHVMWNPLQFKDVEGDVLRHRALREQDKRARVEKAHAERDRKILAVEPVVMRNQKAHELRGLAEYEERAAKSRAWSVDRDYRSLGAARSREQQLEERTMRLMNINQNKTRRVHEFVRWRDELLTPSESPNPPRSSSGALPALRLRYEPGQSASASDLRRPVTTL